MKKLFLILLINIVSLSIFAQKLINGTITRVYDGDTYIVTSDSVKYFIRIAGVDCPEQFGYSNSDQPFSRLIGDTVRNLIKNQKVTCLLYKRDRYGRFISKITVDGTEKHDAFDLASWVIKNGYGWYLTTPVKSDRLRYRKLRDSAKKKKIGLWQDAKPINPAKWRKTHPVKKMTITDF